jgi:alpha-beta hydrolase superfamily lysophospholipase
VERHDQGRQKKIFNQIRSKKMSASTFTFTDPDGFQIFTYKWAPEAGKPKAAVQVVHGAAEHALRYERLAKYLNQAGYLVYADDHRGHGKTAGELAKAGIAGVDGWNGMVKDEKQLSDIIKKENPGLPLFLFGHSMGSFIAQRYIQLWGSELKGVILSGTTGVAIIPPELLPLLEQAAAGEGRDQVPEGPGLFAALNQPFEPAKTPFDWLSCDAAEVQKYIDDPWCGFAFTNGMVLELAYGMLAMLAPENQARVPKNLPVYLFSGELDPVGANHGVRTLAERYKELGVKDVQVRLYPGGRHEMLNETNREQVQRDVLKWLEEHRE